MNQLLPTWVDVVAIYIGAITGSIIARRWGADLAGILLVAIVSGMGGGFIRDVLLNRTPVALTNSVMIPTALVAAGVGFLFADVMSRLKTRLDLPVLLLDSCFLGIYAIIGTEKALLVGLPVVSCVFVGVLTGVGGGLLRDVLLNQEPEILRPGALNAVAAVVGCSAYVVLQRRTEIGVWAGVACIGLVVVLRVASVTRGWHSPRPTDLLTGSRPGRFVARRVRLDVVLPPDPVPPATGPADGTPPPGPPDRPRNLDT